MSDIQRYRSFAEFYPFYLGEHTSRTSRRLHFIGSTVMLLLVVAAVVTQAWWLLAVAVIQVYAFAWVGHYFFEHNKPATFQYPVLSAMGDGRLWWDILTGKIRF